MAMTRHFPRIWFAVFAMCAAPSFAATPIPPGGDCQTLTFQNPGKPLWYGTFSGRQEDDLFDHRRWSVFRNRMVYVRGCFLTEYACRRWLNEVLTAVNDPGVMRCRLVDKVPN